MKPCTLAVALALASLLRARAVFAADGDPDPSFGGTGSVSDSVDGEASAGALVIQGDGKIVAAGATSSTPGGAVSMALVRFESDGTLDAGFGTGGRVSGTVPNLAAADLVVQPDGTLVALATSGGDMRFVRFAADGTLDASFGGAGIATIACGSNFTLQPRLIRQPDGKLVAGGSVAADGSMCVVRALSDGSPDPAFGTSGVVLLPDLYAAALALQPDGKLVIGGSTSDLSAGRLVRLLSDGTLDGKFGSKGVADLGQTASPTGLAVEPSGRIVATTYVAGGPQDFGVARFTATGQLDTSFGTNGIAVASGPDIHFFYFASNLVLQLDGKIVIVGYYTNFSPPIPMGGSFLARFDVDGSLDTTFGSNGTQSAGGAGETIRLQPDGKVVTVGTGRLLFDTAMVVSRYYAMTIVCPATATPGCTSTTSPGASSFKFDGVKDQLQWKWGKGAATMRTDFGDPIATDAYSLCLYDESGASTLVGAATIPPGGTCTGKPCWQPKGSLGLTYTDKLITRFGLSAIKLKAGVAGKAQLQVRGQGSALPMPSLPVLLPLRVQLLGPSGHCWDAVFAAPGVRRNDGGRFQGKSQ